MSRLNVEVDYIKIVQYKKMIDYYLKRIEEEMDRAVVERKNVREYPSDNSLLKIDFSSNL